MTYVLPSLSYPHPPMINPCADAVQQAVTLWMDDFGYLPTEKAHRRFAAGKFATVTARAHPYASYDDVLLVATYMSWLFMLDDLCDEAELGRNPAQLRAIHNNIIDAMRMPRRASSDPIIDGLLDVWERMTAKASPGWTMRFIQTFQDYSLGCQWEAQNRAGNIIPTLEDYIYMRRKTSALDIFFDLIELADNIKLPQQVLQTEHVRQLKTMANDGVAWFNDIVSLDKEIRTGDFHNLVLVLQHNDGLTLQRAIDMAGEMFTARMSAYVEAEARRPRYDTRTEAELERYLTGLRCWVRGNIDWSFETGRYGHSHAAIS